MKRLRRVLCPEARDKKTQCCHHTSGLTQDETANIQACIILPCALFDLGRPASCEIRTNLHTCIYMRVPVNLLYLLTSRSQCLQRRVKECFKLRAKTVLGCLARWHRIDVRRESRVGSKRHAVT
ncbi:unnamed protein product [Clavelina lepadiformis]|uniref:Uncharacterized protein n=1 Tax=Clavelina lepadiformis TaxID=159417 RepID=A0ABP0EYG1_CLALP